VEGIQGHSTTSSQGETDAWPSQTDVIAVLLEQHADIGRLFAEVERRRRRRP
jgi:hypothetical protein